MHEKRCGRLLFNLENTWFSGRQHLTYLLTRFRPKIFDQVGHETMYSSSGNKHVFIKSCHRQTYQNYEQSRQKLGTFLQTF